MTYQVTSATSARFVLTFEIRGQAATVVFRGQGFGYGPDALPDTGTLAAIRIEGLTLTVHGEASAPRLIRLPDTAVSALSGSGWDWFTSASHGRDGPVVDADPLIDVFAGLRLVSGTLLRGGQLADVLRLDGSGAAFGAGSGDRLLSSADSSALYGGNGADRLRADGFNTQLFGGRGDDRIRYDGTAPHYTGSSLNGGAGADVLTGAGSDESFFGGAGDDRIRTGGGAPQGFEAALAGSGDDLLRGGAGRQSLYGGTGADEIGGHGGRDSLSGGRGADQLYGGAGRDLLHADGGRDLLTGGSGADAFLLGDFTQSGDALLGPATGTAVVTDFDPAEDRLWLLGPQRTAAEAFARFQEHARQRGADVVFEDPDGFRLVLLDLDRDLVTLAAFDTGTL